MLSDPYWTHLGIFLVSMLCFLAAHVSFSRLLDSSHLKNWVRAYFLVLLLNLALTGHGISPFAGEILWPHLIIGAATYTVIAYCYFHFVNIGITSIRIRILREVEGKDNKVDRDSLLEIYNAKTIVGYRIERLVKDQQIVCKGATYVIGKKGLLSLAKTFQALKLVIIGRNDMRLFYQQIDAALEASKERSGS